MATTLTTTTQRPATVRTLAVEHTGIHPGNDAPAACSHHSHSMSLCVCIIAIFAYALLPTTAVAQSDHRIPWLTGLQAITVSVNVFIDGNGMGSTSPCHLNERPVLERHVAEVLHGAGLDAISEVDNLARLRALQAELNDAIRAWEKAPLGAQPPGLREQAERRQHETEFLGSQPFLYVLVGVATIDGGLCTAGITTELRAFTRDRPVINYNGEQVQAPLALWGAIPLAVTAPAAELERAVEDRLDRQITEFITAWRTANGR